MKYNRFAKIPSAFRPNKMKEYEFVENRDEIRITDDKFYKPNNEALAILARNSAAQILDSMLYDNLDDLKNGAVNVYARQKKRDLAELTQQQRQLQAQAEKQIKDKISAVKAQQAAAQEAAAQQTAAQQATSKE